MIKGETAIELCEPAPFLYYENGQIAVTDGTSAWLVIVTSEAMKATANPPEYSLRRLVRYSEYYRDLAAASIRKCNGIDGKVWITEADVLSSPGKSNLKSKLAGKPYAVQRRMIAEDGSSGHLLSHR